MAQESLDLAGQDEQNSSEAAAVARQSLEAARASESPIKRYDLLRQAQGLAPEDDKELQDEISAALENSKARLQPTIITNMQLLKDKTDYDKFAGALAILEGLDKQNFSFTAPQLKDVREARQWMDQKTISEGGIISAARIEGLQSSYVIYRQWVELPIDKRQKTYHDETGSPQSQEEYGALLTRAWKRNSQEACNKRLQRIQQVAKTDPAAAKAALEREEALEAQQDMFRNRFTETYLFNVDDRFFNTLTKGELTASLRSAFQKEGHSLTGAAKLVKLIEDNLWAVVDESTRYGIVNVNKKQAGKDKEVLQVYAKAIEKRRIPEHPYVDEDQDRVKDYIAALEEPCRIATEAQRLREQAYNSSVPFSRYELLIKARDRVWTLPGDPDVYRLPSLDKEIYDVLDAAVKNRYDEIQPKLDVMQQEMDGLPRLGADEFSPRTVQLAKDLAVQQSLAASWPGEKTVLKVNTEGKLNDFIIEMPPALTGLGTRCREISTQLTRLTRIHKQLLIDDKNIRFQILSTNDELRQVGLRAFDDLKESEPLIEEFRIYKELAGLAVKQGSFESGARSIEESYGKRDWAGVLALCSQIVEKKGYQSDCPKKIQANIARWKREADANLRQQKIKDAVARGNYRLAASILDGLRETYPDQMLPEADVKTIEQVKAAGGELVKFYEGALRPFGFDAHVLRDILVDPDGIFDGLSGRKTQDQAIVHEIAGKERGAVTLEQYEENIINYLERQFKQISLEQKTKLLGILRYTAGLSATGEAEWPAFTVSLVKYEAGLFARYFSRVAQQAVLEILKDADQQIGAALDKLNLNPAIDAAYEFDFKLSDAEHDVLRRVEIAWADICANALLPNQSDEKLRIWEGVRSHFGMVGEVAPKYSAAKTDAYVGWVRRFRANGRYPEGLKEIENAFNDVDVGTAWQLHLEKAYVCFETRAWDEAEKSLEHFGHRRMHPDTRETRQLRVRIELGRMGEAYADDSLGLIRALIEYRKNISALSASLVGEKMQAAYDHGKKQYGGHIAEAIEDNRERAWAKFLQLRSLEDLYLQMHPEAERSSDEFLEQLLPSLYSTGIRLLEECDDFFTRCNQQGVSLVDCFEEGEPLQIRMSSYDAFLKDLMRPRPVPDSPLFQVVRDIITKIANSALRKNLLANLNQNVDPAEARIKYSEFTSTANRLKEKVENLEACREKWEAARKPEVWFEIARRVMLDQSTGVDAWANLKSKFAPDDRQYCETQTIIGSTENWDAVLKTVNADYFNLKNSFSAERFVIVEGIGSQIGNRYGAEKQMDARACASIIKSKLDSLSDFSEPCASSAKEHPQFHLGVIQKLKTELEVSNSLNGQAVCGLENIEDSIDELQIEIEEWEIYKGNEQKVLTNLESEIGRLQMQTAAFEKKYDELRKNLKNLGREKEGALSNYLEAVKGVGIKLCTQPSGGVWSMPLGPVIPPSANNSPDDPPPVITTQNPFWDFLPMSKKNVRPVNDPLLEAVKSSAETDFPLVKHEAVLAALIAMAAVPADGKPQNDQVSSRKAKALQAECLSLAQARQNLGSDLSNTDQKYVACMHQWPFPKSETFKKFLDNKQYLNLAATIVEADLTGARNEDDRKSVDTYRGLLKNIRERQRR